MLPMHKALENTSAVAFKFFIVLGGLHITSSLLIARGILNLPDWLIFNVLDLPFLFVALVYGSCRLSLGLENITGNVKIPLLVTSVISLLLFAGAIYINFIFPDASLV